MEINDQASVYFARTNFRGEDRIFGIKTKDRRQHMYVVGKTGCGKSVMLKNIAVQDIQNGSGIAVVDPHGELVEEILASIPPHRINDVIYFNPADAEFPIGFNVLEVPDPKYKHVVASDLMGIFTKIWANVWSARMEYIMQNCIMALLDTPGTTLLGIPRLLVDREYRTKIIANIKDPVVRAFWTQEYENYTDRLRSEAIVPIQNKVGQFLNTSMVRNIMGQPKSGFNVQDVMNSGKILLVNVSKGRIGEDNSALLGAMMITKLQLGAMERVRVAEKDRKDFYLYVDEFQNFATDSFASVLSEARKYRLNLVIAHQYIGQLVTEQSTKVRDAVFGNAGTIITFRVGAVDAEFLETEFTPEFLPEDLVNLPNYHIYTKLMVDGVTSRPFSATTLPPIPVEESDQTVEKIIKISRERYSLPRKEVEERIMRWSGMDFSETESTPEDEFVFGPKTAASGQRGASDARQSGSFLNRKNDKAPSVPLQLFNAVCARCKKQTEVNFQPDGRRPVYCKLCLPIIRSEEVKKLKSETFASSVAEKPASQRNVVGAYGTPRPTPPNLQQSEPAPLPARRRPGPGADFPTVRPTSFKVAPAVPTNIVDLSIPNKIQQEKSGILKEVGTGPKVGIKAISLKDALQMDGLTFSGKRLKRKEVDLTALREALGASLESRELPDAPTSPEPYLAPQQGRRGEPKHETGSVPQHKGAPLRPGQIVTLRAEE
ncbi:MAG: type IV secretion system DNA-binding domain-containing protein [bacterium]|nr:type IV secretion system DNA-binding domain-containing protein [bacterium]